MLKKILSPETCAPVGSAADLTVQTRGNFRYCRRKLWKPCTVWVFRRSWFRVGEEQTFAAPPLRGEELFFCPMLCETGCTMGADKPFDCRIWPFRMMRDLEGALRITVASYCPGMQKYTDAQLRNFWRTDWQRRFWRMRKRIPPT